MDLAQLYETVKPIVWILTMKGDFKGKSLETGVTAFAVKEGFIMSCAHGDWPKWNNLVIRARPLSSRSTTKYDAIRILSQDDCDVALYKVEGVENMAIGNFGSGELVVGETVMCVGHPHDFVGSGMTGKVLYPCPPNPSFFFQDQLTCEVFDCCTWLTPPIHRVMGHACNQASVKAAEKSKKGRSDIRFVRKLKARLPIIQTSGLVCGPGSSGAPMFNLKGQIIGMHVMDVERFDIGIHVRVLERFLQLSANYHTPSGGDSMEVGQTSGSSSGKRRRKVVMS